MNKGRVNRLKLTDILTDNKHPLHWGGSSGLWDICRHKIIGIPVLDILHDLCEDPELKRFIKTGTEMQAVPHVEKIQEFLKKEELAYPSMPQRKKITDQQIGLAIMEILRLSLVLDNIAFMDATRGDLRKFIWDITEDDKKAFDKIVELNYEKNWIMNPPSTS